MRVWGHPRSGNHFLASVLHQAFYEGADRFAMRVPAAATGHWSQRHPGVREGFGSEASAAPVVPWGHLIGSHAWKPPMMLRDAIYIYRDGRDVALSVYGWSRFRAADEQKLSLSEYLRRPIDWIGSPGFRAPRKLLLWEHWRQHVEHWLAREDVLSVRYEDLAQNLDGQLQRIATQLGVPLVATADGSVAVGWNASKARDRIGRWRDRLSESDMTLYDELVPRKFAGRYDHA